VNVKENEGRWVMITWSPAPKRVFIRGIIRVKFINPKIV
jgi:hypothetical protein